MQTTPSFLSLAVDGRRKMERYVQEAQALREILLAYMISLDIRAFFKFCAEKDPVVRERCGRSRRGKLLMEEHFSGDRRNLSLERNDSLHLGLQI